VRGSLGPVRQVPWSGGPENVMPPSMGQGGIGGYSESKVKKKKKTKKNKCLRGVGKEAKKGTTVGVRKQHVVIWGDPNQSVKTTKQRGN